MFYNIVVNMRHKTLLLPATIAAGSFLSMLILMASTSPMEQIAYTIALFCLMAIFFISVGYFIIRLRHGEVTAKSRYRVFIISFLILVAIMLRSSQALNLVDSLVLVLIAIGIWFYGGRRLS
jgi:hypothetical protein